MQIRQLFDATSSTYSYLLWDTDTQQAALIDSVKEQVARDSKLIDELGLNLQYLLETHIHADHITGSGKLRQLYNAKIVVHRNSDCDCADILADHGDDLSLGEEHIKILYTPGHTNTDISYLVSGAIFTGDTLLIRGSGRTDFQSGDAGMAYDSIVNHIFTLPNSTVVYPGHDYNGFTESSIREEKILNPRLGNNKTRTEYIAIMNAMNLPKPKLIDEAVPSNIKCGN